MSQRVPLYRTISDALARDIKAHRYQPGQKFPSEAALVKRFGASRITVGHAVRELQERGLVDRIAGSGTYVANLAGHSHRALLFGLVIPNLGETEIFEPICQGIAASPGPDGHGLLWPHAGARESSKEDQAIHLCRQCIAREVSGVFFAPLELSVHSSEINRRVLKLLKDAGIPVVLLDRRPEDEPARNRCDLVGIDNHRAGFLATGHLLQLGVGRIGFVAYENQATTVKSRIAGYSEAIEGKTAKRVLLLRHDSSPELPETALECEAFVCANDRIAGHLMHALLERRIRIPDDVRIVGIDDVNYASLLPVPLTTVHQPCRDIGETALRVMLERLQRPKMAARDVLLDCSLVIRRSCGARPA